MEAGAGYVHPLLIFVSAAVGVVAIFFLALRFCALSILSFHAGATYLNVAKAVAGGLPYEGAPNPFAQNYRDYRFIGMPKRAGQVVDLLAPEWLLFGPLILIAASVVVLLGLVLF